MYKEFELGKLAYSGKNYDEAITRFKSAIEKIPVPPPAKTADVIWANLAMTYDAKKEYGESEAAYKKAIEFNPAESAYHVNLSLAQLASGKTEESQASIVKAAELNPANAGMAYYNMGATLINRNKPKEAITFFKKAVELDPLYSNAFYQLGITLIGENENAEAITYLEKYLNLVPTGQDAETAKLLIAELKKTTPTSIQNAPATGKAKQTPPAKGGKQ
jgi:superkiller protein 3